MSRRRAESAVGQPAGHRGDHSTSQRISKSTPGMRQWRLVKSQHPDHLLLFRMGDFYETFHEDAETAARTLGIALTSRGTENGQPIPLAGIPHHQLDTYLGRLVRAGLRVAVCEQMEDPRQAKGIVKRDVVRLVTPGTLVEEALLDEGRENCLAALRLGADRWGLALAELSTGALRMTTLGAGAEDPLRGELSRFAPAEILIAEGERGRAEALVRGLGPVLLTERPAERFAGARAAAGLAEAGLLGEREIAAPPLAPALDALAALVDYLRETQRGRVEHLQPVVTYEVGDHLVLDATTLRGLDLVESQTPGAPQAHLLAVIDHTRTAMGKRCLRGWLLRPLRDRGAIGARLDAVGALVENFAQRSRLRDLLRQVADLERILGRVGTRRATPRDLAALRRSLETTPRLREALGESPPGLLATLAQEWVDAGEIRDLLARALVDEPPAAAREGGLVRDGWSAELDALRAVTRDSRGFIRDLQAQEIARTGIQSLRVGFNKVFGYYLEVTNANRHLVPPDWIRKQTLVGAERYITPALKEKEEIILQADERIAALEAEIFESLCAQVAQAARRLQRLASQVATVDALVSLAEAAVAGGYVRPEITEAPGIEITDGRHPVLETLTLGGPFVPNSVRLDPREQQILVITGPNMAGKSTLIRQVALIVILAHMGSFVPARAARIGLVDRVFTRVGATDHLARGQSTFLVEMSETANILHHATDRSLVILDEIGRGTSTYDGLAIAWAVIEHLHGTRGCRPLTLFATHYHELAELQSRLARVRNFHVAIHEDAGEITFLYRLRPGHTDHSYGIHAARLAGLPAAVVTRAQEILFQLECGHSPAEEAPSPGPLQLTLFDTVPHPALERLRAVDVDTLTPVEALRLLDELARSAKA